MKALNKKKFSNKLDLNRFFFALRKQAYVIVKLSQIFPNYYPGSDIDIFCYHKSKIARIILALGNQYVNKGFKINVFEKEGFKTCIDFYFNERLDFRFELYQSLPNYKKIHLKKHYFYSIIENAKRVSRTYQKKKYFIYLPSIVDELLLRYVEYIEWYQRRPDKIKHLNYIKKAIAEKPERISFLDKLHLYTKLPETTSKTDKESNFFDNISKEISFLFEDIRFFFYSKIKLCGKMQKKLLYFLQKKIAL